MEVSRVKNVASYFVFPMVDKTTPESYKSGETVTDTAYYKDGAGSWTSLAITDTVSEIGSTGLYSIDLTAGEMNHDQIVIKLTATNSADTTIEISTIANPSADDIADKVWDEALASHTSAGTFGKSVADIEGDTNATQLKLPTDNIMGSSDKQSHEGTINAIKDNTDATLIDTNEMQGKLPTNNIMGSSVKTDKDDEIDSIKSTVEGLNDLSSGDVQSACDSAISANTDINNIDTGVDNIELKLPTNNIMGSSDKQDHEGTINSIKDDTDAILIDTNEMQGKLPSKSYLAGTNNSDGDIEMNSSTGQFNLEQRNNLSDRMFKGSLNNWDAFDAIRSINPQSVATTGVVNAPDSDEVILNIRLLIVQNSAQWAVDSNAHTFRFRGVDTLHFLGSNAANNSNYFEFKGGVHYSPATVSSTGKAVEISDAIVINPQDTGVTLINCQVTGGTYTDGGGNIEIGDTSDLATIVAKLPTNNIMGSSNKGDYDGTITQAKDFAEATNRKVDMVEVSTYAELVTAHNDNVKDILITATLTPSISTTTLMNFNSIKVADNFTAFDMTGSLDYLELRLSDGSLDIKAINGTASVYLALNGGTHYNAQADSTDSLRSFDAKHIRPNNITMDQCEVTKQLNCTLTDCVELDVLNRVRTVSNYTELMEADTEQADTVYIDDDITFPASNHVFNAFNRVLVESGKKLILPSSAIGVTFNNCDSFNMTADNTLHANGFVQMQGGNHYRPDAIGTATPVVIAGGFVFDPQDALVGIIDCNINTGTTGLYTDLGGNYIYSSGSATAELTRTVSNWNELNQANTDGIPNIIVDGDIVPPTGSNKLTAIQRMTFIDSASIELSVSGALLDLFCDTLDLDVTNDSQGGLVLNGGYHYNPTGALNSNHLIEGGVISNPGGAQTRITNSIIMKGSGDFYDATGNYVIDDTAGNIGGMDLSAFTGNKAQKNIFGEIIQLLKCKAMNMRKLVNDSSEVYEEIYKDDGTLSFRNKIVDVNDDDLTVPPGKFSTRELHE